MHNLQNIAVFFGIMLFTAHRFLSAFVLVTVILALLVGSISACTGNAFWLGAQYTALTCTGNAFWLGAQYTALTCTGLGLLAAAVIAFKQVMRGFR